MIALQYLGEQPLCNGAQDYVISLGKREQMYTSQGSTRGCHITTTLSLRMTSGLPKIPLASGLQFKSKRPVIFPRKPFCNKASVQQLEESKQFQAATSTQPDLGQKRARSPSRLFIVFSKDSREEGSLPS